MIILGIDPGTNLTGFGIIRNNDQTECGFTHVHSGVIKLPQAGSGCSGLSLKLEIIYKELIRIIRNYSPDEFAIETAFYGKNVQSAMKIGYARGTAILAAAHCKIPSSEYSPREVKKSIVGRGAASKEQVSFMIRALLAVKQRKMKYDETDALAVALCHAFRMKKGFDAKKNDWKSFIEKFPERVVG